MSRRSAANVRRAAVAVCLASLALAAGARAAQYPPGPNHCCPDTLTIINLQNPNAVPHPEPGDVVLGVGGIITAFDRHLGPFSLYMQMSNGLPYSGVGVFTGNVDHGPGTPFDLQVGDSIVTYGKAQHFEGADAIGGIDGTDQVLVPTSPSPVQGDLVVRVVSHGNAQPPMHVGTLAEFDESNATGPEWAGMLVRLPGPLVAVQGPAGDENGNTFLVMSPSCSGTGCSTVEVDGNTLTQVTPPPPGTTLAFVQGVFDLREGGYRIQLRGPGDFQVGTPPAAIDAFPIFDNDQTGSLRLDSLMVVFDRPVEKTSAQTVGNYSLASLGAIDGARRLDAPNDNRVVLEIRNGLADGAPEAITVSGVASLADGTPMPAPTTLAFFNGVIELDKVRAPDPVFLAGVPCQDRSRYSGPGSTPGARASFVGTVTGAFGGLYTLQGTTLTRGGMWVNAPSWALTPGHAYILAGALEEVSGETQGTNVVYVRDLGSATAPAPSVQPVHVLIDETCDAAQLFLTGDDLDGMLVTLNRVAVVGSEPPGTSFYVATPGGPGTGTAAAKRARGNSTQGGPTEQILVAALAGNFAFAAEAGRIVTITGVLGQVAGAFAVFPRSDADIEDFGPVPTFSLPLNISKAATASRDPDIVCGVNGDLFMAWGRDFHESVHSLSQDGAQNWSRAFPIAHQGVEPAVAVTPSDKFCVLQSGADKLIFKQSSDGGFQIDPTVTIVDGSATSYPALTVGSGEHLHAAWERTGLGIYFARSLTGGADFETPIPIAPNTESVTNSMARICATKGDTVFVFWQYEQSGEPPLDKVLYSRSLDGGSTFSTPRQVRDEQNPLTSTVKLALLGDAQVGPDGTVYAMGLQQGGPQDSVAFLRSTNGGATFALVGHPTGPAATGLCPKSFVVGPAQTIHALVGVCGTALYYTRSTDGGATWGPAVDVTSSSSSAVGEPRGAKIILDSTGTPVIVWFAPVGGSTEIHSARLLN